MDLAHTLKVHHQHTSLEVAVCVAHMQLLTHVLRALAVLHIEIADEIDIRHCADRMVAEFGVEQFGDVAVDHQIAIQIQQLRIERQRFLDDEAVVGFDADMSIAGGEVETGQITAHVEETQHGIRNFAKTAACNACSRR